MNNPNRGFVVAIKVYFFVFGVIAISMGEGVDFDLFMIACGIYWIVFGDEIAHRYVKYLPIKKYEIRTVIFHIVQMFFLILALYIALGLS